MRYVLRVLFALAVLARPSYASNVYFSGLETGDASEVTSVGSGAVLQSTTKRTGTYAYKLPGGNASPSANSTFSTFTGLTFTTNAYLRFALRLNFWPVTNGAYSGAFVTFGSGQANVKLYQAVGTDCVTRGAGLDEIELNYGGSAIGSKVTIQQNTWYVIELREQIVAGTLNATVEMKVDGVVPSNQTASNKTSNTAPTVFKFQHPSLTNAGEAGCGGIGPDLYIDDISADNNSYPGIGRSILRTVKSGTPTDTGTWTTTSSQAINVVWGEVPPSATNASTSNGTSLNAQTALVNAVDAGTDPVASGDTLNTCKVGGLIKRAGGPARTYNVRYRYSGCSTPSSGICDNAIAATTADVWYEQPISQALTIANLNAMEIGGSKSGSSQEMTVEDIYLLCDYTPVVAGRSYQIIVVH